MSQMNDNLQSQDRMDGQARQVTLDAGGGNVISPLPLLLQYWQMAFRWRWVIGGIIATCIAVGLVATMLKAPLYSASSEIEISRAKKNVTNVAGVNSDTGTYDMEFYDTQYALLKEESLADRVARKMLLAEDDSFFAAHGILSPEVKNPASGKPTLTAADRNARERVAAGLLLGAIKIAPVRNSSLVDITYTSRSPEWSAKIANVWAQEYIAATMDREFSSTADARRFLEGLLVNLRTKLEESERNVADFAANHDIVPLSTVRDTNGRTTEQKTLTAENLASLNEALIAARIERIAAQSRLGSKALGNSAESLTSPAFSSLRAKRMEVAADYARTLQQFEPEAPDAQVLKRQIDALDGAIERETQRIAGSRQLIFNETLARERELAAQVEHAKAQFSRQQLDNSQYNIFVREADTNRQLYDALLQRYKEVGISGSVGTSNIAIVNQAKVPEGPSAPNLRKSLAIALLIGAALSALFTFGIEQIDHGIRDPSAVEQLLKLPLLGNVPLTEGEPLVELNDRKSFISESYLSVLATLEFATSHGLPRSLMVTSAQANEGKSTTAFAIAMAISRTGKKVLLVDGDMRSPTVHKLVNRDNQKGFSNLLTGDNELSGVIAVAGANGLSVLPAGPTPPSSAELLSKDRLAEIIELLQLQFDHIVIDSPPILGLADAPLLGRAVEGCVLVVQAEKVAVGVIRNSLERMRMVDSHIFGVVVTKIDYRRHQYGYGYGYGYGNAYGYGNSEPAGAEAT